MIDVFQIESNGVVFRPEALAIKEFAALWKRDKTKEKKKAFLEMSFVFYTEDLRSPFKLYPVEQREQKVIEAVFDEKWEPDSSIKAAQERYRGLTNTRSMILLKDTWASIDKLGEFLRDVTFASPKDASSMKGVFKDMPGIVSSLKKLEEEVRKELEGQGSLKGGRDKAFFEDPTK